MLIFKILFRLSANSIPVTGFLVFYIFYIPLLLAQTPSPLPNTISDCSFNGSFTQSKSLSGLVSPLQSTGVLYYHCEHGVIWKTTQPIQETLIFKKQGLSYVIDDGQAVPIKTKLSKFIGNLLFSLMRGDNTKLKQSFYIEQSDDKYISLTPIKRSVKKAVQKIELSYFNSNGTAIKLLGPEPIEPHSIEIIVLDRNNEATKITSVKNKSFSNSSLINNNCTNENLFSSIECNLLLEQPAKISNSN